VGHKKRGGHPEAGRIKGKLKRKPTALFFACQEKFI
jgi:hypothetical protein